MNLYKYMKADDFCNYFYNNPKLKISKLNEFSDVYEPDTFINSFDIKDNIEQGVFKIKMQELNLPQKLILNICNMNPKFWQEVFNPNTSNIKAKIYRNCLINSHRLDFKTFESEWKKGITTTITQIQEIFDLCEKNLLILCLSEQEGSQILYDNYGQHKGVMLEFDSQYITDMIKVEYGQNLRKNYFINSIPQLIQLFINAQKGLDTKEIEKIFFKTYAFKNKDYDYEHEYRIIKNLENVNEDPQLSKLGNIYLIDIGIPKSITLGYRFHMNEGAPVKELAIKKFCKDNNIKLYQALKNDFDDEIMQRKEINID